MDRRSVFTVLAAAPAAACATAQSAVSQEPASGGGNRAVVTDFIRLFYGEKRIRQAFETHVVENYIQHNPMSLDGRETAIVAIEGFFGRFPNMRVDVKRILVDGDLAAVHIHIIPSPGDRGFAVVDLVRLENGKIVEHWDVLQPVPENPPNPKAMF